MAFVDNNRCFLCGKDNPIGLRIDFRKEGEYTVGETVIPWFFQGFQGVAHGGIVASLLDEVMSHSVKNDGLLAVTGSLQVKYHRPCLTGQPVLLRGKVEKVSGRVIEVSGEVIQDDNVVASGKGIFVIPRQGVIRK